MDQQLALAPRSEVHVGSRSTDNQWVVVAILDPVRTVCDAVVEVSFVAGN